MSEDHGGGHHTNYFAIFGVLCFCTIISVVFDWISPDNKLVLIVLVLGVAVAKALFVMAYFMHLKFEGNWKFLLLSPTVILAMGLPLALYPDIGVHYYTLATPQAQQTVEHDDHASEEAAASPSHDE